MILMIKKMMMMMMFLFTNCQSSLQSESGGWKVRHHGDPRDQAGQGDHHYYHLEHYRHHYHYQIHEIKQDQGCIFRLTCFHAELTKDRVLTSAHVKNFRTVTRNAMNKRVWRKKGYSWLPLNNHAMNIWLSSLRIRAHLSWRTGKHLHVLHVLRTYSTCSYPGY